MFIDCNEVHEIQLILIIRGGKKWPKFSPVKNWTVAPLATAMHNCFNQTVHNDIIKSQLSNCFPF